MAKPKEVLTGLAVEALVNRVPGIEVLDEPVSSSDWTSSTNSVEQASLASRVVTVAVCSVVFQVAISVEEELVD